jgi:homoserine O-acetyltransferase
MLSQPREASITEIYAPVDWADAEATRYLPREVRAVLSGPQGSPLIVALGGISADADVASDSGGRRGWWSLFEPSSPLGHYRVLGIDFAGDDSGTYAPSPHIQSHIIDAALRVFGETAPFAVIGASYGGMVALAWAERVHRPDCLLVIISADDEPHPAATAIRGLQRRMVDVGLRYDCADEALAIARGLAMVGYRSPQEFRERFKGGISGSDPLGPSEPGNYLLSRGSAFLGRMSPGRYLSLSASIDRQRVNVANISNPALLIGVDEDQIVPPVQMEAMARRWGGPAKLKSIQSTFGHDAFLKEVETLAPIINDFLEGNGQ